MVGTERSNSRHARASSASDGWNRGSSAQEYLSAKERSKCACTAGGSGSSMEDSAKPSLVRATAREVRASASRQLCLSDAKANLDVLKASMWSRMADCMSLLLLHQLATVLIGEHPLASSHTWTGSGTPLASSNPSKFAGNLVAHVGGGMPRSGRFRAFAATFGTLLIDALSLGRRDGGLVRCVVNH